jgi:hypothetical protein
MNVAAAGVVAGKGRGLLPGFPTAARVLVIAVGEGLMRSDPEALDQKQGEKHRRDALRKIEVESTKASESVGHQTGEQTYSV